MVSLHLTTKDTILSSDGTRLHIKNETIDTHYAYRYLAAIYLGPNITLNSNVIAACYKYNVPIYFSREQGYIYGSTYAPGYGAGSAIALKQLQMVGTHHTQELCATWLVMKFARRSMILEHLKVKYKLPSFMDFESSEVLAKEGAYDAQFWKRYLRVISNGIQLKRVKRDPPDIWNASLNYLYGMLYYLIEKELIKKHLDPYMGFHHGTSRKQKAFLFDIIEPFRPFCEEILINLRIKMKTQKVDISNGLSIEWRKTLATEFHTYIYKKQEQRFLRIKIIQNLVKETANYIKLNG
ncbi:CRISPR-associated endonuclease Cas1 [Spirosomataceae bacterium TFI 002]|nr:CRISPR-associated endonuclease Cas1 [Spirosomataceae bacterium TFI 002]